MGAKGILLAVAILAIAGCGQGQEEWRHLDGAGREWAKIDSVATAHGEVAILTQATHEEYCAIKHAVNAIAEVAAAHPEHNLVRHNNPAYFFVRNSSEKIPTMCLPSGKCVDEWRNIPAWLDTNDRPDGLHYNIGKAFELIMVKGYPDNYWWDFSDFLYVVIHEEVHGLGSEYAHGALMDKIVGIIHKQAVSDLPNDPECREIRLNRW